MVSRAGFAAVLLSATAIAHDKGFHKKLLLTVTRESVELLVAMDIDGNERTAGLRAGADANHDGVISGEEAQGLKKKLVRLAEEPVRVAVSGYALSFEDVDAKVDLRGDRRVDDTGISVAVLRRARWPGKPIAGMTLSVSDESPDPSPVAVEVHVQAEDGGDVVTSAELDRGKSVSARLDLTPSR
jgi:hypothetical protein